MTSTATAPITLFSLLTKKPINDYSFVKTLHLSDPEIFLHSSEFEVINVSYGNSQTPSSNKALVQILRRAGSEVVNDPSNPWVVADQTEGKVLSSDLLRQWGSSLNSLPTQDIAASINCFQILEDAHRATRWIKSAQDLNALGKKCKVTSLPLIKQQLRKKSGAPFQGLGMGLTIEPTSAHAHITIYSQTVVFALDGNLCMNIFSNPGADASFSMYDSFPVDQLISKVTEADQKNESAIKRVAGLLGETFIASRSSRTHLQEGLPYTFSKPEKKHMGVVMVQLGNINDPSSFGIGLNEVGEIQSVIAKSPDGVISNFSIGTRLSHVLTTQGGARTALQKALDVSPFTLLVPTR